MVGGETEVRSDDVISRSMVYGWSLFYFNFSVPLEFKKINWGKRKALKNKVYGEEVKKKYNC